MKLTDRRIGGTFALAASALAVSLAVAAPAGASLMFNLSFISSTGTVEQAAFTQAAAAWSSVLADNVTVNLTVGTAALGAGILASAQSATIQHSYSTYRTALSNDATSANDAAAVASLINASNLRLLINYTSNNPNNIPNAPLSATPYLDDTGLNTSSIRMTNALAKAVGLGITATNLGGNCSSNCDGYIAFSNSPSFSFDTDPSNGITAGQYDFVGIAIHEIGHALGFISGVDVLDNNTTSPGFLDDQFTFVSPLDLFRCSAASAAQNAIDWTTSTTTKNFSLDNCGTTLASFSTGSVHGDGQQASHWKDNLGLGIMDPTVAPGELLAITPLDLAALDVIGWNLQQAIPAPASALVFVFGLAGLGMTRRRA